MPSMKEKNRLHCKVITQKHTSHFNGRFPGKRGNGGTAICSVILILNRFLISSSSWYILLDTISRGLLHSSGIHFGNDIIRIYHQICNQLLQKSLSHHNHTALLHILLLPFLG